VIPLRDDVPSRTYPFVNVSLIGLNVVAFLWELSLGPRLERALFQLSVVPRLFTGGDGTLGLVDIARSALDPSLAPRVLLSMFLHGGLAHIFGNMLYLWIFGDNVEDRMGHGRYLVFYLLCGWLASLAHVLSAPDSRLPSLGASGAIAGVLGAYFILYPRARVVVAWPPPLFLFLPLMQVPAFLMLGLWFFQEFISGLGSLGAPAETGGVAFWAHAGGFAAGMLLVRPFQRKQRRPVTRDFWWEVPPRRRRRV
jgi:membrane associated rhomboid family serine protease